MCRYSGNHNNMADTFKKKSLQQNRAKKKQDKLDRKIDRKSNNNKGKDFNDMITYIDENGNFTDIPPSMQIRKIINAKDIPLESTVILENREYTGIIEVYFFDKSYGFISEQESNEKVFVHGVNLLEKVSPNDKVIYKKEKTPKGFVAIQVKRIS